MKWVAAISVVSAMTGNSALAWAVFVLIAVAVVTAVFSSNVRIMNAAQEVLRILFGRRHS